MQTYKNIDELRAAVDLRKVIEIIDGKKIIRNRIVCPFHDDHSPSFSIYKYNDHLRYKCHGASCGIAGDVFSFIKLKLGFTDLIQVLEWIDANRLEIGLNASFDVQGLLKELGINYEKKEFWNALVKKCKECLLSDIGSLGVDWLRSRGVLEPAIPYLPVGYFHTGYLGENGTPLAELRQHGIEVADHYQMGCIAFFYYSTPNDISRIKLRDVSQRTDFGKEKEIIIIGDELGSDLGFFCLDLFSRKDLEVLTLVEGELDVLVPQSMAIVDYNEPTTIISQSGAAAIQETSLNTLQALGVKHLFIWPDNDKGGHTFVERFAALATPAGFKLTVQWPKDYLDGEDPADFFCRHQNLAAASRFLLNEKTSDAPSVWLARKVIAEYQAIQLPTESDLREIRTKLVSIGVDAGIQGFALDDYVSYVTNEIPVIRSDSLRHEISNFRANKTIQIIGEKVFMIRSDGYHMQKISKEAGVKWLAVTNFTVSFHRVIQYLDDEKYCGSVVPQIESVIHLDGREYSVTFVMEDFMRFDAFMAAIRRVIPTGLTYDPTVLKPYYEALTNAFNFNVKKVKGYNTLGLNGSKYVVPDWIVEDGEVQPNNQYVIPIYDQFMKMYDVPLVTNIETQRQAAELIATKVTKLTNDHARHIPLYLMGHIAASPLVEMLNLHPGALYIEGLFDIGKSTICQLMMNLVCHYPMGRGNVSMLSTPYYVETVFNRFCGVPVFLDDVKREVVKGSGRAQFLGLLQGYHDRQGRGRLTKNIGTRPMPFIRGHLIMSGENLPTDEGSALSRMLILDVKEGDVNFENVSAVAEQRLILSTPWPYYIAWLQKHKNALVLDESYSTPSRGRKSRLDYFINYIGTGLNYYLTFLEVEYGIDKEIRPTLLQHYRSHAVILERDNRSLQVNRADHTVFMETLEMLLHSGQVILGDPVATNVGERKIGFREGGLVYIYPPLAVSIVGRCLEKDYSERSLTKALKTAGYLEECKQRRWASGPDSSATRSTMWVFRAERLYENLGDPQKIFDRLAESVTKEDMPISG